MYSFLRKPMISLLLALGVATLGSAGTAFADATIRAELWEKPSETMPTGLGLGMHGDMSKATMGIKVDHASVPAGKVTFVAINTSKTDIHEMLVSPIASRDSVLPFIADEDRVDEDAAGHLGEVSELDPGQEGALTITLKPGLYVVYCNIPGHYMAGMWTIVEVK